MKFKILIIFIFLCQCSFGQNEIAWDGKYQLSLNDIKASTTQIGNTKNYSIFIQNSMAFEYHMSQFEFMITKNFNKKVKNIFKKDIASIIAPDSAKAIELLNFCQYIFDLNELYSRKLRKKLFEEKNAFSDPQFYKPIYENLSKELIEKGMKASKETDFGVQKEKLKKIHLEVLSEIETYSNFCYSCKPRK